MSLEKHPARKGLDFRLFVHGWTPDMSGWRKSLAFRIMLKEIAVVMYCLLTFVNYFFLKHAVQVQASIYIYIHIIIVLKHWTGTQSPKCRCRFAHFMRKGMKAHVLALSLGHIFGDNLGRCSLVSLNNYFSWFGIQQIHSLYGYCL